MLIRSQDRRIIVNMDNVTSIMASLSNTIIVTYVSGEYETIGMYSTEEKAIEVLKKIQIRKDHLRLAELDVIETYIVDETFTMPLDKQVIV